jgi:hypothetical protein
MFTTGQIDTSHEVFYLERHFLFLKNNLPMKTCTYLFSIKDKKALSIP